MPIQLLLADDHQIVREGLRSMLEHHGFRVVGEAADGREAVRLAATTHPDVVILDLAMPILNGLDAAREIVRARTPTRAILLTVHQEDPYVLEALRAGISGYVLKTQAASELVQAIREVVRGAVYLSPGVSRTVVDAYRARTELPVDPLTPREREVLQLVAEGKTTKEAATVLGVSTKTAESHRTHIMSKLDIHETAGLVRYAIRRGLIQA
ncbi:MAG TPA: response regulator transcription factor [Dongiaceae bacterium]|nr:response regulator transcription factor [Dongiaceae bacterium]